MDSKAFVLRKADKFWNGVNFKSNEYPSALLMTYEEAMSAYEACGIVDGIELVSDYRTMQEEANDL